MDAFQLRALEATNDSLRRLRDGHFAEPELAAEEIRRLAGFIEPAHTRYVEAWLGAESARRAARATRQRARQGRLRAERNRVKLTLSLIDLGEPASGL